MGYTQLDKVLTVVDEPPAVEAEFESLSLGELRRHDFGSHVLYCHRTLAEIDGPQQKVFAGIADQMERELGKD